MQLYFSFSLCSDMQLKLDLCAVKGKTYPVTCNEGTEVGE
jgi:hypothetical protein